jgi:hypothetical protein
MGNDPCCSYVRLSSRSEEEEEEDSFLRRLRAFFDFFAFFLGALLRDLDDRVKALLAAIVPEVPVLSDPFSFSRATLSDSESKDKKVGMAIDYGHSRWIVPGKPVVSPSARPATWCHMG